MAALKTILFILVRCLSIDVDTFADGSPPSHSPFHSHSPSHTHTLSRSTAFIFLSALSFAWFGRSNGYSTTWEKLVVSHMAHPRTDRQKHDGAAGRPA
ncbi:hypothetical protein B0T26DRAFT_539034 [Lasiosphaeria miniovina]|uniref:Secreted protein n=1 Tax=Lasiosphaeria miniovina TaxID=1954250 RepID=A0AA39ZQV1_9PEZI|nr:uncharacterized protein B0T26DRAFT_539034 [Lasiosphaeria miniovina]KAK0702025.1 hypothetical protein B0T26DRAFT_539034 [Lasiosphaeria miniovina]